MPYYHFDWDAELIEHLAEHGVSQEDFKFVVENSDPSDWDTSESTGRPIAFGQTADGRLLACVFELDENKYDCVPVTAYEVD